MRTTALLLLTLALPAAAAPGFFDNQIARDKVLRKSQCTAHQVLACEIRCAPTALADGKPSAEACGVSKCRCEDATEPEAPRNSMVIFDAYRLLGLAASK